MTHVDCGRDGWGHLTAVIDCHDREIVGWEFSLRGRAKEAEMALESASIEGFGTLRPEGRAKEAEMALESASIEGFGTLRPEGRTR